MYLRDGPETNFEQVQKNKKELQTESFLFDTLSYHQYRILLFDKQYRILLIQSFSAHSAASYTYTSLYSLHTAQIVQPLTICITLINSIYTAFTINHKMKLRGKLKKTKKRRSIFKWSM